MIEKQSVGEKFDYESKVFVAKNLIHSFKLVWLKQEVHITYMDVLFAMMRTSIFFFIDYCMINRISMSV